MDIRNPLCVALDLPTRDEAIDVATQLADVVGYLKIGLELFCGSGPEIVREIKSLGTGVFLDLKFMDIPNTVSSAMEQVGSLGIDLVNVHALGGHKMLAEARSAIAAIAPETKLLAVTILTSLDSSDLNNDLGISGTTEAAVLRLAQLAQRAGLAGVVASPKEISCIRQNVGDDFIILTPGIRPTWAATASDQKRIMTPADAIRSGANIIVVGRPVTNAKRPRDAAEKILREIEAA